MEIYMTNIAILGFGVVGCGTAELITNNYKEVTSLAGDDINIKYILDLRDFPDSPFADKVIHDYDIILNDPEVSVVIEVMGGSHPAYEFTVSALSKKKSVITSNKEVVANFGDEFTRLAEEMGVSYRYEASVGGGIPVIEPMLSCVAQNKIKEVRGILNGTTNYILTKMFDFGDSFESALSDAQARGYAERNPDADVLGTDAARKISILTAIATGKLVSPELIHTEGITAIRGEDVKAAALIGGRIKLVGRCINTKSGTYITVSPFIVGSDSPLFGVMGVYNAVEIVGEPIGNIMFFGKGAGAGATASAVVGDLAQVIRCNGSSASKKFEKSTDILPYQGFESRHYVAFPKAAEANALSVFGKVTLLDTEECSLITEKLTEADFDALLSKMEKLSHKCLSHIRLL